MPKATITLPDETLVTIEGDPEEISRILRLYSESEGAKAEGKKTKRAPVGEPTSGQKGDPEEQPRRRVSIVWWLGSISLAVLVLGWIGVSSLSGKIDSLLTSVETLDQAVKVQAASVATQTAGAGLAPSLLRTTPAPTAGCSATKNCTYQDMTLCFLQVGAEGDWRTANTASMKETAQKLGANLIFADAQAKQENQISAMHACIQRKVSVIALSPLLEDGWEAVLLEARNAGIPVILVDRRVNADPALYATHIGSDMVWEGERAAAEFNRRFPNGGSILEISGAIGSSAAANRGRGFRSNLNSNIKIIDSQTANFTRSEAFPVMQAFLQKYKANTDFHGIFIHNDDMGVGAIEAMKAAGIQPGDLFIVSIDATRNGFQAMIDGWFQADVECNPLLGPQVFELALKLMNGERVDREVPSNETVYYPEDAPQRIPNAQY